MLTERQKLLALEHRFYNHQKWIPKEGDYYTSTRSDLELYRVVGINETKIFTVYADENRSETISEWDKETFLTEGFGINRVHVPDFIFKI